MKDIGKGKKLTHRTGNLISHVAALMQVGFGRRLKKYDVTRSQWMIMAAIFGNDAETAADIAKIWKLDATAVTRLVDRLEAKGLVKRIPSNNDRRIILLHDVADRRINRLELTEQGQRLSPILKDEADANHDYVFGALTETEENQLRKLLSKILKHLSSS